MSHKKKFNLDNKLDKIENKISRLNKSFNDTFWLTRISEGSYTHSYWQDYFDFEFPELNKKKTNNNFFKFFQYILVFFSNFTKDLILSLLIYQNTKFKKKNIIYLNSKHIRKTKHTNYSFLTEDKIDNHTDNIYLISISRSSSNSLLPLNIIFKNYLRFKKNNNIIILESFLKPLSVLKNYLFIYNKIKISFKISKKLKLDFSKFVSFIIDISKQSSVLSILSNKKFSAVFSSSNFLICPVFELVEGRTIIKLFNNLDIKTIGLIHGLPGKLHNLRMVRSLKNIPNDAKPKVIFTTGKELSKEYKKYGFKKNYEIGYLRQNNSIPRYNKKKIKKKKIIILLDRYFFEKAIEFTSHLNKNFDVYYKPHPLTYKVVEKYLYNKKKLKIISNINFSNDHSFPEIIISTDTGAVYEFIKKKYPCYYFDLGLNNSFLVNSIEKKKFKIFNINNILKFSSIYKRNQLREYKVSVANKICNYFGNESKKRLNKFSKILN